MARVTAASRAALFGKCTLSCSTHQPVSLTCAGSAGVQRLHACDACSPSLRAVMRAFLAAAGALLLWFSQSSGPGRDIVRRRLGRRSSATSSAARLLGTHNVTHWCRTSGLELLQGCQSPSQLLTWSHVHVWPLSRPSCSAHQRHQGSPAHVFDAPDGGPQHPHGQPWQNRQ